STSSASLRSVSEMPSFAMASLKETVFSIYQSCGCGLPYLAQCGADFQQKPKSGKLQKNPRFFTQRCGAARPHLGKMSARHVKSGFKSD
ncbi:hypothetical protein LI291_16510, partial [Intestinibacillus massiliensis]|nr:hypothetical protein [Intestinibacillus massiliensis]